MQAAPGQVTRTSRALVSGEFFVPDLCAPRSVLSMVLLVELMVLVYTLSSSSLPAFDWNLLAVCSLFGQWVVLLSAALLCLLRQPLSRLAMPLAAACCLLAVLAATAVSSVAARSFLPQLFGDSGATGWWLLRNLLVAMVLAGIVLRYFYLQQQLQVQQKMELQARLDALRARIRPHFLFNTLNSVASLIMSRPEDAERVVEDLSELLRVNLQEGRRDVTVADELRICELYLGIEQLRLGERLRVDWQVDPAVLERAHAQPDTAATGGKRGLPRGVAAAGGAARSWFVSGCAGQDLGGGGKSGYPSSPARSDGHQIALDNIGQRLQALYGSAGNMEVTRPHGGYRIELSYPPQELV